MSMSAPHLRLRLNTRMCLPIQIFGHGVQHLCVFQFWRCLVLFWGGWSGQPRWQPDTMLTHWACNMWSSWNWYHSFCPFNYCQTLHECISSRPLQYGQWWIVSLSLQLWQRRKHEGVSHILQWIQLVSYRSGWSEQLCWPMGVLQRTSLHDRATKDSIKHKCGASNYHRYVEW